jgi:hypothetical protein
MPKEIKVVTISAHFPELKGPKMYQQGRGRGSSVKVAAANAVRNLLKQPGLKSQRYSMFKATIAVGSEAVNTEV